MRYDRDKFFASVKPYFRGKEFTQSQVDGVNAILDYAEKSGEFIKFLAYMLATAFHETGQAMQPIIETRGPKDKKNPSVDTAISRLETAFKAGKLSWVKTPYWRKDTRGFSWLGRGFPQVTHYANYLKMEKRTGVRFTDNPEAMLLIEHALPVMFIGMKEGLFTRKKLSDYFGKTVSDPVNARRIINGVESADLVAKYYHWFLTALLVAETADMPAPTPTPAQPVPELVVPPPPQICPTCGRPYAPAT